MTTAHALLGELAHHQFLKEELRRRFPDEDEQALADTLEGESNLNECLAEVARSIADDSAMAQACKLREADLAIRRKRHEDRVEAKRNLIATVMERAGLKNVPAPDVTLSLGAGRPRVVVTSEAQLIAEGFGKTTVTVDMALVRNALTAGSEVMGACLSNTSPVLTLRTK